MVHSMISMIIIIAQTINITNGIIFFSPAYDWQYWKARPRREVSVCLRLPRLSNLRRASVSKESVLLFFKTIFFPAYCLSTNNNYLRRGVRSDAQLRPTETRFQKCSQSGKNGSKHPMLSISMAYNVISCKKVERNTQKLKIADFTM